MSAPEHDRTVTELEQLRAERDALQSQVDALHTRRRRTGVLRRVGVIVLVILTCVSLTGATVAVWANRTLLSTEGWVATVAPLGEDPAVLGALQPRITEAVFTAIPAQELIADVLPPEGAFLAVPLASAIQGWVDDQVGAFLVSDTFATLWVDVNQAAHSRALAVLRGESDVVQVEGETVTLNLLPIVNGVLAQVSDAASGLFGRDINIPTISGGELPDRARERLNAALGVELPENIGQIPVYNAEELIAAQQALRVFDQTLVLLVIATPLLLAAAVWLSRNRRATILQLTVGSMLLLVLVRRVVLRFQENIVSMPPRPEGQQAARAVTDRVLENLFAITEAMILIGVVIFVLALVTGPYRWAVAMRSGIAQLGRGVWDAGGRMAAGTDTQGAVTWITRNRRPLQLGGPVFVILLLLLFDLSWGWFLALLVLLACWEVALWRLGGSPGAGPPTVASPPSV